MPLHVCREQRFVWLSGKERFIWLCLKLINSAWAYHFFDIKICCFLTTSTVNHDLLQIYPTIWKSFAVRFLIWYPTLGEVLLLSPVGHSLSFSGAVLCRKSHVHPRKIRPRTDWVPGPNRPVMGRDSPAWVVGCWHTPVRVLIPWVTRARKQADCGGNPWPGPGL